MEGGIKNLTRKLAIIDIRITIYCIYLMRKQLLFNKELSLKQASKMKQALLFTIGIVLIFTSCKTETPESPLIFSGQIENPNSDSLSITGTGQKVMHTFYLSKDNTFSDTISIEEGEYSLLDGTERTHIYLKPGFNLHLYLNTKEFDESIVYTGKGAAENNFLAERALLNESFGKLNYYGYYGKLSENAFLKLNDSLYNEDMNLFNKHKAKLDGNFSFKELNSNKYWRLYKIANFQSNKRSVTGDKKYTVSSDYPNPFVNIDLSDEKLFEIESYIIYVDSYVNSIAMAREALNDSTDDYIIYVEVIEQEIENKELKEIITYRDYDFLLAQTEKLNEMYQRITALITNEAHLEEIKLVYQDLKKLAKGSPSPTFSFYDINEKRVSLDSLKGKIVYIDIWATWCLPCIKEIPDLQKLEEELKGEAIQFVSICTDDDKERWQKMVREKALGGIQLYTPKSDLAFFTDYKLEGIPRFILIDKQGNIVDANAMRPSDEKLKEQLESLL